MRLRVTPADSGKIEEIMRAFESETDIKRGTIRTPREIRGLEVVHLRSEPITIPDFDVNNPKVHFELNQDSSP